MIFLTFTFLPVTGRDYRPSDLKNPNIQNRSIYVTDPENLLNSSTKEKVNQELYSLRKNTGAEVAIVVVPSIDEDFTIEDFSEKLFTSWGIGKSDKDNGLLFVLVPGSREARIATGYGLEGVIPDISARKIIDRSVIPYMKNNDINGAVLAVTSDISTVLSDPVAAAELKSSQKDAWETTPESDITGEDIIGFILIVIILAGMASWILYIFDSVKIRKKDRYQQALAWHGKKSGYLILTFASLGLGLIPYLLMLRKYKRSRNSPMDCPVCKSKMNKLNEEEDNALLTPSQDFEEKLNTVDYDVWVCPTCGTIEKYPFKQNQLKYEECPSCHTIAMTMIHDHTLVPATTYRQGTGERVYECKFCHYKKSRKYVIPKKADATAAAIAAGSMLGSSGRGGGGFGGGFGGGRTGGGGATGRW